MPLCQNQSLSETIHMKICSTWHFIFWKSNCLFYVHVKGFAWGLNLKERYNFLAVTQEWPIIESTGSITTQLHNQPFKNTFEGKMQTILFALMHRTHTFPPAVTSKPVAVDTSLTCISWATRPFTCKHNKNGVGSSLRVHLYRSARTYVLTASVVECQSTCTWKLIYSIGTQLTSVNDCQTRCQSSVDQVTTELPIKYWLSVGIDTQLQMQWSDLQKLTLLRLNPASGSL